MKKVSILMIAILAISMVTGCVTTPENKCGKGKCAGKVCPQKKQAIKVLPAKTESAPKCNKSAGKSCCKK